MGVQRHLPSSSTIRRSVQRQRQAANRQSALSHGGAASGATRETMTFPSTITTVRGEPFLLRDTGASANRIVVFGSRSLLESMREHPNIVANGTFKSAPKGFFQLFTIHMFISFRQNGRRIVRSVPVIYALLPDKTVDTYQRLFQIMKELLPGFSPETWICDFERAIRTALMNVFPLCQVAGCFFHFMQNILKKVYEKQVKV